MKEEWRTLIVEGKEHIWYSISNYGNIVSHITNKSLGRRGFEKKYDPNHSSPMKPVKSHSTNSHYALKVNLRFPENFFEEYEYFKHNNRCMVQRKFSVHQLVMWAFKPIDLFPPDRLKDCWDEIPESAKQCLRECLIINHKDHNPSNNHVDNLEYVTPKENSHAAVKHYGGNFNNKSKQKEVIKIIDPIYYPLLDEWEDGRIEFHGEEGEELYAKLEEMAKEENKTPEDFFFDMLRTSAENLECTP